MHTQMIRFQKCVFATLFFRTQSITTTMMATCAMHANATMAFVESSSLKQHENDDLLQISNQMFKPSSKRKIM
jgi:hypothetical protein